MNERLYQILLAPHLSEKGMDQKARHNVHVFRVRRDASKPEIKRAVETAFEVEVESVRTINVQGKKRRVGRNVGKRPDWKKAYVTIKPGSGEIEYFEGT